MTTFKQDIERKIDIIWRIIIWAIAFLIALSLCLPGIFISIQYSTDDCVRTSSIINFALDGWLFIACIYIIVYMLLLLIFICIGATDNFLSFFLIFVHFIQLIWYIIGIYLVINSTLKCKHNSLWQLSVAYCAIMGSLWILETICIILKWLNYGFGCRENSLCARLFQDNPEMYYFHSVTND